MVDSVSEVRYFLIITLEMAVKWSTFAQYADNNFKLDSDLLRRIKIGLRRSAASRFIYNLIVMKGKVSC